ncbi:uncharacterized protein MELLADRAFT_101307 [Melampsora larici-populina 98AG31]|uniref:Uncharacterized protein n=1 Tax=Melampsora larici-populina (strain 98AG31 / pathotype 3-4-7) TaxID=747676 RepID=F4R4B0_MELLP|nr:uncharacterized protein MELLADRAFT_101307 [Melampsora larici-populina 98AG31]EGG12779.1 hypothetical protein MELLADRAFT_101307 [Melampsora larici-populina 98AG31]
MPSQYLGCLCTISVWHLRFFAHPKCQTDIHHPLTSSTDMGLSTIELVASSLGTSLVGGVSILLASKLDFLKEQRWRGPKVVVCIAAAVSAILAWATNLMEVITREQESVQGQSSGPGIAYGLMVLVFGLTGTLKRLTAWSRLNRENTTSVALQTTLTWVAWIFIALAMIESLVFLFMSIMSVQPPSLVLVCGLRISSRAISAVLEMIYIWSLIGYLLTNATHNISFKPIYEICKHAEVRLSSSFFKHGHITASNSLTFEDFSSGILALIVIAECSHPSAFPDLAKERIASRRSESIPEKYDSPRSFLSVRLDSSNLSECARDIIKEAGLGIQTTTEGTTPGIPQSGKAVGHGSSVDQRDHPSDSELSRFVDCTTPSISYVSQTDLPETIKDASIIEEIKESKDLIHRNHSIQIDANEDALLIFRTTEGYEIRGIMIMGHVNSSKGFLSKSG